jgi:hypothetical protein
MKPDWDKLGDEFAQSSVVIGDVDCTVHQDLCGRFEVRGYPTIKYWAPGAAEPEAYNGGRTYDDLKKHAETLVAACSVTDPKDCDEKETGYVAKMQAKDGAAQAKELARLNKMKGNKMSPKQKKFLFQRINILEQLTA